MTKYYYLKRLFDIIGCLIILIVLGIPMLIIALMIMIETGRPIFFIQKRTGYKGKNFNLYKFRSMSINNDVYDKKEKDKVTKVGKILRRTSLDELGQIINVLKGEMSFIGPRPWLIEYYTYYNDEQKKRCDVLPGITGLAQACGRNNIDVIKRIEYDLEYVKKYSLIMDIKVIILTITSIFKKSGFDNGKEGAMNDIETLKMQTKNTISKWFYKIEVRRI